MTTCRTIITRAEEALAVVGNNRNLRPSDAAMALELLNTIVEGVFGAGVGGGLTDDEITSAETVAVDTRAIVSGHSAAFTITLPESPRDGSRFQLVDAGAGFTARPVTVARNGRLLEGAAANITANTNGFNRTWFYRADLGDWKRLTALAINDTFPFPASVEQTFALMLAFELAPSFRVSFSPEAGAALQRGMSSLRAKYRTRKIVSADSGVLTMSLQVRDGGLSDLES